MTKTFYIAHHDTAGGDWYMLIVRDTHFCLSCGGDLERLLKSLKRCVKRTKTKERLMRELSGLECEGKVSPTTFDQREQWYRLHGEDYADLVHFTVLEALKEVREEEKENSPLRKTTKRLQKVGRLSPLPTEERTTESTPTPQEDSLRLLKKPKVFNRK